MSRYYEMSVEISGYSPDKLATIQDATSNLWPFSDWDEYDNTLSASGCEHLCGGESEQEFTERLSLAVWRANGAYCKISVNATYLESLPFETHSLTEADYARLIGGPQEQQDANGPGR